MTQDNRENPLQLQRYFQSKIAKSSPRFINILETRTLVLSATMALVAWPRILLNLSEHFGMHWSCCFNISKHCAYRMYQPPHVVRTVLLCMSIIQRLTCNYYSKNINHSICRVKAMFLQTCLLNFSIIF